jgi:nitrite reductase (cytochrome c-552)
MKVSDHWVRSPLKNISKACQQCHRYPEDEIKARVDVIQQRNFALLQRAGTALTDMLDTFKTIRAPFDAENRPAAEAEAKAKLEKDTAYTSAAADAQATQLAAATKAALNAKWAAKVAKDPTLEAICEMQRKAQWRLDFVAAENSMGFHAPQEAARILAESADDSRQAEIMALRALQPTTQPVAAAGN